MGWLIALAVLVLLGCLPLGARVIYEAAGPAVSILIGPAKIPVFPGKKKEKIKPEELEMEEEKASKKEKTPSKKEKPEEKKQGGSFTDFLPLVRVATDFLSDFRRKLRVKRLELLLCMAGGDPCDLGINYGRAWAAIGNLMPQLERFLVIKKRNIQVSCDFTQSKTTIYFRADVTITLGRTLFLAVRYGIRALKEYLKISNKRKGGALK